MNYVTTDTELTSIANAIRNKGGTSASLEYPQDYITAINNLSGGGVVVNDVTLQGGGIEKQITAVNLSSDTVDAEHLVSPYTAHDSTGQAITGSIIAQQSPTMTVSGSQVTVDAGYYLNGGTANVPNASIDVSLNEGMVWNASLTLTPKLDVYVAGYVSSGSTGQSRTVTASELVSGNRSITQNGTGIDVTNYATVSVNVQPNTQTKTVTPGTSSQTVSADTGYDALSSVTVQGDADLVAANIKKDVQIFGVTGTYAAATNIVIGSFTTPSSSGATTASIPYTGSGYPIAAMVFIKNGAYNNTSTGDTNWYNSTQRYAVGQWTMSKSVQTSTPTYRTSGTDNQGVTTWVYKNDTSSATTYSRSSAMNTNVYTSSNASNNGATCVRFKGNGKTLSYYVASTSYGLLASTQYTYIVVYSS